MATPMTIWKSKSGRTFYSQWEAEREDAREAQIRVALDAVRPQARALNEAFNRHSHSGVADSEGCGAVYHYIRRALLGENTKMLSFESLQGYTGYAPSKPEHKLKSEIARDIRDAAKAYVAAVKVAMRAQKLSIDEDIAEHAAGVV